MSTNLGRQIPIELKWIEEPADPRQTLKRPDEEFEPIGRDLSSVLKKCKENIFVPLGLLATVTCLTMGLVNLQRGDIRKQQLYMRGRVGFQAFTLAAMVLGTYLTTLRNRRSKNDT